MSDYPMLISNKLHSFRNFNVRIFATRKGFLIKSLVLRVIFVL